MAKSIKFIASGSSSALGNFAPGDIARNIPDALADHLVKEAACAQYLAAGPAPVLPVPPTEPKAQPRARRKPTTDQAQGDTE